MNRGRSHHRNCMTTHIVVSVGSEHVHSARCSTLWRERMCLKNKSLRWLESS
jgi:hypothetical protein